MTHARFRAQYPRTPFAADPIDPCPGEIARHDERVDESREPPGVIIVYHCPACDHLIVFDFGDRAIRNDYPHPRPAHAREEPRQYRP